MVWTLLADVEEVETAGLMALTSGVSVAAAWLFSKYQEWRKTNRAESLEDRDRRRKEAKEDEAATLALMRETMDRMDREAERKEAEHAAQRKADRDEVHALRDRLQATELRLAAEVRSVEARLGAEQGKNQRLRVWLRYLQGILASKKIEFDPYTDDTDSDTDVHRVLQKTRTDPPPPKEAGP